MPKKAHRKTDSHRDTNDEEMLYTLLGLIQKHLLQTAEDTELNKELLELGLKGDIAQKVETFMLDPLMAMYDNRQSVDESMAEMINAIVIDYLKSRKKLIHTAVHSDIEGLHYCISLDKDNFNNRSNILEFSTHYKDFAFASKYPVHLQIVPVALMDKIRFKSKIFL